MAGLVLASMVAIAGQQSIIKILRNFIEWILIINIHTECTQLSKITHLFPYQVKLNGE